MVVLSLLAVVPLGAAMFLRSPSPSPPLAAPAEPAPTHPDGDLPAEHPLDPALAMARELLEYIEREVRDYECTLTSRERVGDTLREPYVMAACIRNRRTEEGRVVVPLSVYLKFVEPASMAGQEVLWVEGKDGNRLLGHQGGTLGRFMPSVRLDPQGPIAMRGNRYPISDIGVANLARKLLERGLLDRRYQEVEVEFKEATIDDRPCTLIEVRHPVQRPQFDFYMSRIYVDKELKLPVSYAAYSWPEPGSSEPVLIEEYTYTNMKVNVGLTDEDFDENNAAYGFH
jgi:hypothetical protein